MTNQSFNQSFINSIATNLNTFIGVSGRLDKPMVNEQFSNNTDYMCKNGEITEHQYNNWTCPKGATNLNYLKGIANKL